MVFSGTAAARDLNPFTNVPYTSSVRMMRSGRRVRTRSAILSSDSGWMLTEAGLEGLTPAKRGLGVGGLACRSFARKLEGGSGRLVCRGLTRGGEVFAPLAKRVSQTREMDSEIR